MVNSLHWSDSVNKVMPNKNTAWDIPRGHYYFLLVQARQHKWIFSHLSCACVKDISMSMKIHHSIWYSSLLTFAQHHSLCLWPPHFHPSRQLQSVIHFLCPFPLSKSNRMSIIFNDIWKYFPSVCVAINHPKWGIVGIFTMGRYQKLAIPNIVKWTKIFQTIPWKRVLCKTNKKCKSKKNWHEKTS